MVAKSNRRKSETSPEKAGDVIRVRIAPAVKEQLSEAIADDFGGNYSAFLMECVRAAIVHHRRGEKVRVPVEFVTGK